MFILNAQMIKESEYFNSLLESVLMSCPFVPDVINSDNLQTSVTLLGWLNWSVFVFSGPSTLGNIVEEVTHPCNPNPCPANELCEVNRKGCPSGDPCLPYSCVQGKR